MLKTIWEFLFGSGGGWVVDENQINLQAKIARILFESLKKEGFTEQQALDLVAARLSGNAPVISRDPKTSEKTTT